MSATISADRRAGRSCQGARTNSPSTGITNNASPMAAGIRMNSGGDRRGCRDGDLEEPSLPQFRSVLLIPAYGRENP